MITKLPDKWREDSDLMDDYHGHACRATNDCADQLQAALPTWEDIDWDMPTMNDGENYMVEADGVMFIGFYSCDQRKFYEAVTGEGIELHLCSKARPLCDLDQPGG